MSGKLVRGLRRVVDVLQRGLFDDAPPAAPETVAPADADRHPRASRELVLDGRRIAFLLRRSRRRSIGFVVGADGLVVSAPKWVALREIDAAVREKGAWILARLAEQRELAVRVEAARVVWRDGAELLYLGRPIRIVLDARHGLAAGEVVLEESVAANETAPTGASPRRLHVGLPADAGADRLRDAVQSWLQREARTVFEARCGHYAERLGVRVTRLSLSSAATRWGSANASGAIRLHWRLIHFPLATIDYVVAHELAHLREMNHSPRFWSVVRSVVPGYEAARRELHGERLAAFD
jgi:predicted metal-dependent hydrolase